MNGWIVCVLPAAVKTDLFSLISQTEDSYSLWFLRGKLKTAQSGRKEKRPNKQRRISTHYMAFSSTPRAATLTLIIVWLGDTRREEDSGRLGLWVWNLILRVRSQMRAHGCSCEMSDHFQAPSFTSNLRVQLQTQLLQPEVAEELLAEKMCVCPCCISSVCYLHFYFVYSIGSGCVWFVT